MARSRNEGLKWRLKRGLAIILGKAHRTTTCAFCGHEYPPGTPGSRHELLTEHIKQCREHPVLQDLRQFVLLVSQAAAVGDVSCLGSKGEIVFAEMRRLVNEYNFPSGWIE